MNKFRYSGGDLKVTAEMKATFDRDGYVIIQGLLGAQELDIVESALQGPASLSCPLYSFSRSDGDGRGSRMAMWNNAGSDSTGVVARMRKMAGTAEQLLGGEVYHYHGKLIMKDARTGGNYVWHQDYGYWYNFNCLYPDMLTTFVALDNCDRENGCLQILRGSHKCGRVDHVPIGVAWQVGADLQRVAAVEAVCERLYVELEKGDAIFFHCNLLHTSAQNLSDRRRWALLACYSRRSNNPYAKDTHAQYMPLNMLDNDALKRSGVNREFKGKELIKLMKGAQQVLVQ